VLRRKETGSDSGSTTIYATLFLLMKTSLGSFACVFTLIYFNKVTPAFKKIVF